jgi:hypothetical protein
MPPGAAAAAEPAPEAAEVSLAHVLAHAPPEAAAGGAEGEAPPPPHVIAPALERLSRGQWVTAWLYVFVLSGVYSQQNLLSPNLTAIQHEFGFTPEERDKKLGGAHPARPACGAQRHASPPRARAGAIGARRPDRPVPGVA